MGSCNPNFIEQFITQSCNPILGALRVACSAQVCICRATSRRRSPTRRSTAPASCSSAACAPAGSSASTARTSVHDSLPGIQQSWTSGFNWIARTALLHFLALWASYSSIFCSLYVVRKRDQERQRKFCSSARGGVGPAVLQQHRADACRRSRALRSPVRGAERVAMLLRQARRRCSAGHPAAPSCEPRTAKGQGHASLACGPRCWALASYAPASRTWIRRQPPWLLQRPRGAPTCVPGSAKSGGGRMNYRRKSRR